MFQQTSRRKTLPVTIDFLLLRKPFRASFLVAIFFKMGSERKRMRMSHQESAEEEEIDSKRSCIDQNARAEFDREEISPVTTIDAVEDNSEGYSFAYYVDNEANDSCKSGSTVSLNEKIRSLETHPTVEATRISARNSLHVVTPRTSFLDARNHDVSFNNDLRLVSACDASIFQAVKQVAQDSVLVSNFETESQNIEDAVVPVSPLFRVITLLLLVVLGLFLIPGPAIKSQSSIPALNAIYVPGGGFSGFWYTLGLLKGIDHPETASYHCYSAGCLAVVATLAEKNMEEMLDIALDIQTRWREGNLHRFDVVEAFVDDLLFGVGSKGSNDTVLADSKVLDRINIITTAPGQFFGTIAVTRSPRSVEELHKMLLQTTWIPFAVGRDLWFEGHMDGAFSFGQHSAFLHNVKPPFDVDVILNTINVNLGPDKAEKYWNYGLKHGL